MCVDSCVCVWGGGVGGGGRGDVTIHAADVVTCGGTMKIYGQCVF